MINSNESNLAEGIGLQPGEEIGRYEVVARIAIGGQSIIYKCHDPALDRLVAIKQISSHLAEDKMFLDRFRTEAQILARLGAEQPEVVTIHDLLENKQGLFIVMEFVEGISLERTLSSNPGPVELKATLQILWRLCSALHTVHSAGVIHRDIKPSNIIIADGLRPMITDFGVAATSSGEASMVLGSTKYMAPELFTGGYVDGRADMYSLGFVAYEMLVGREKFNEIFADIVRDRTAEKVRWMKWHSNPKVSAPPAHEVNPAVPITLSNIVVRMMAKDSEKRFEGMEDLGRAIKLTFRPGGRPAGAPGAPVPTAAPLDEDGVPMDVDPVTGRPAPILDIEDAVTAPIPKRKLSVRAKVSLAVAALLLIVGGLVVKTMMTGNTITLTNKAAAQAYQKAREAYKSDRDYAKAQDMFLGLRKDYAQTTFAEPSLVYIHMCRAHISVKDRDWSRAQSEQSNASDLNLKIQKASVVDTPLYKWTLSMKNSIREFDTLRIEKKAFAEAMGKAEQMYTAGEFDGAVASLLSLYPDRDHLDDGQRQELRDFEKKVNKTKSLNECEALLAAARKVAPNDPGAALVAWEDASTGLTRLRSGVDDPTKWDAMNTEVQTARAKYAKEMGVTVVMKNIDDARNSGDLNRLITALRIGISKPGMPAGMVAGWTREIAKIKRDQEFAAISKLLVEGKQAQAIAALDDYITRNPDDKRAQTLRGGIQKELDKKAKRIAGVDLFTRGRWPEAWVKLKEYKAIDRGDREINDMIKECEYQLALGEVNVAVDAEDYDKAVAAGEKARGIYPDRYITDIEPKLMALKMKLKIAATLREGAAALKSGQYADVRKILDHLKSSYPAAAEMIKRSKYLENLERGNALLGDDVKTAWATYKTAKSYAQTPAEHKEIDALIAAAAKALGN